jgi:hypothetical protein
VVWMHVRPLHVFALVASFILGGCERRSGGEDSGAGGEARVELTPSSDGDPAARYIVFRRKDNLFALLPDGSAPIELGISAPRWPVRSVPLASNEPIMSPDGRTLAHLVDGELRITQIPSLVTHEVAGLEGPVFIGSWSPDGKALLVLADGESWEASLVYVVDITTLTATSIGYEAHRMQWGNNAQELFGYNLLEDGSVVAARVTVPDLDVVPVPGISWRRGWAIADVRANHVLGTRLGYVWVFSESSTAESPRDLVAIERVTDNLRLSPDARYIALCIVHEYDEFSPLGEFTVVPVAGGPGKTLTDCFRSSTFHWYDDEHIVIQRENGIRFVALDGELVTLAEDAGLVRHERYERGGYSSMIARNRE